MGSSTRREPCRRRARPNSVCWRHPGRARRAAGGRRRPPRPQLATTSCRPGGRHPGPGHRARRAAAPASAPSWRRPLPMRRAASRPRASSAVGGGDHLPVRWRHPSRRIEHGERRAASRPRASSAVGGGDHLPVRWRHPSRRIEHGERRAAGSAHLRPQLAAPSSWCAGGVPLGASSAATSSTASGGRPAGATSAAVGGGHLPLRLAASRYRHAAPPTAGSAAASMSS